MGLRPRPEPSISSNCCSFIQPDTAISRNRNGSRDFVMRKVTLSPAVHGPLGNPLQILCRSIFRTLRGRGIHTKAATIQQVVIDVSNFTDRPLLDHTSLKGLYDIDTDGWVPMRPRPPRPPGTE